MRRLVLITFTPSHWSGGVNRWVRDVMGAFPDCVHYSAADLPGWGAHPTNEWDVARALAAYLRRRVSVDDVVVVDGFWGLGWEWHPNVVSVCHGIWSHLTLEDSLAGAPPDFPQHHRVQLDYRRRHVDRGGRLVAVSDFIAHEMMRQWSLPSVVIDNAVDLGEFFPVPVRGEGYDALVIHGVNDPSNVNKGWEHVEFLKRRLPSDCHVVSLDEAHQRMGLASKAQTLAQADLVVIPSAFEGNSYFCLESLACDVPVVAYNVGLPFRAWSDGEGHVLGRVLPRDRRRPEETLRAVQEMLGTLPGEEAPRTWVSRYSLDNFRQRWREYVAKEFGT